MTVRVRFAPSPTGYLHVGGARTALYNYLFAAAQKGTFILRIEDTDLERSSKEYEMSQVADLKWLGFDYDEGPDRLGDCGPYRQSERIAIYKKYAEQLIDEDKAYYCFCSDEELTAKKELAKAQGLDPRYDGTCRNLDKQEAKRRVEQGAQAVIRFKVKERPYQFVDKVRGEVVFPAGMVGDFVIMRSNGLPVYNYCCVIDDWLMDITHVIRAEDHIANTLRQLMLYEAFNATPPEFAHISLIVGEDRQKLSKRHGAVSVGNFRELGFLPQAMVNYLCLLGWSHPEEKDIFDLGEIKQIFDLARFTKASALFDLEKLKWVNGQHLRSLLPEVLEQEVARILPPEHIYHQQDTSWKMKCIELFREKIQLVGEIKSFIEELFSPNIEMNDGLREILSWETTPTIKIYLGQEVEGLVMQGKDFAESDDFERWSNHIKKELKIKGKPLFMGMRGVLTGKDHGADLKVTCQLTPLAVLRARLRS